MTRKIVESDLSDDNTHPGHSTLPRASQEDRPGPKLRDPVAAYMSSRNLRQTFLTNLLIVAHVAAAGSSVKVAVGERVRLQGDSGGHQHGLDLLGF